MANSLQYESLHSHTEISDGKQTHLEVLNTAEQNGFGVVAFTDHDILPSKQDMQKLKNYSGPVEWTVGIEMSSGWPAELGGGPANLFHILGLGIDIGNVALNEYCQNAVEARRARLRKTVSNLVREGFEINVARCEELAGSGSVGSPHIREALLEKDVNLEQLKNIAGDMRMQSRSNSELDKHYSEMMRRVGTGDNRAYVHTLLLSGNAFIEGVYEHYSFTQDMDSSVELIRNAGGVAILAHWPTVKSFINEGMLMGIVVEGRLDGVELRTGFTANPDLYTDMRFLESISEETGCITTVGIDSHAEKDFSNFLAIPDAAKLSIGKWKKVKERI